MVLMVGKPWRAIPVSTVSQRRNLGHRLSPYLSDGSAARRACDRPELSDSDSGAMLLSFASEAWPMKFVLAMAFVSAPKSTCFGSIMSMSEL